MPSSTTDELTTHRSRRRRREPHTPAAAADKENSQQPASSSTVADSLEKIEWSRDSLYNNKRRDLSPSQAPDVLLRFRAAVATQSTSSSSFWNKHASLAEGVVRSSVLLSEANVVENSALLLEEHAAEVLQTCRVSVKEATEGKDVSSNLYVAIHGIRSILSLLVETTQREATFKVLYYAVKLSTDQCLAAKNKESSLASLACCLAALQAMGKLLSRFSLESPRGDAHISFCCQHDAILSFPLPVCQQSRGQRSSMSIQQVFKICIQSVTDTANCLSRVSSLEIDRIPASSRDFGRGVCRVLARIIAEDTPLFDLFLNVVRHIAQPWMTFLTSPDFATDDTVEEALGYGKRTHALLLEAAAHIDKRLRKSSSVVKRADLIERALALRGQAVVSLLLSHETEPPSRRLQKQLRKRAFETGCTLAWKASALYVQQRTIDGPDDFLCVFHEQVGRVLDSVVVDGCASYMEYCVHRALHFRDCGVISTSCELSDCLFSHLSFPHVHSHCLSRHNELTTHDQQDAAVMRLVFVMIALRRELQTSLGRSDMQSSTLNDREALIRVCDTAVHQFRRLVLGQVSDSPPLDVMLRYQKLLELPQIDRQVFEILSSKEDLETTSSDIALLGAAGTILVECTGPFVSSIFLKQATGKPQHGALAVESFIRAAQLFEYLRAASTLSTHEVDANSLANADLSTRRLFDFVSEGRVSLQELERAAKATSAIGRRRLDRKERKECLLPVYFSARLFWEFADRQPPESGRDYQIPMRIAHLASIFQDLNMTGEACISLVLAVSRETFDSLEENQNTEPGEDLLNLLRNISSLSHGFMSPGEQNGKRDPRLTVVKRLVQVCRENQDVLIDVHVPTDNVSLLALWFGLEKSIARVSEGRLPPRAEESDATRGATLADLLRAGFQLERGLRLYNGSAREVRLRQLFVACQILSSLGICVRSQAMDSLSDDGQGLSRFVSDGDAQGLLRLVYSINRRLSDSSGDWSKDLVMGVVNIVFAVSLVSTRPREITVGITCSTTGSEPLRALAVKLSERAQEHLDRIEDNPADPLISTVRICAKIQFYHLNDARKESELMSILATCHAVISTLNQSPGVASPMTIAFTASCLLGSLAVLRTQLSGAGDDLRAAEAALMMVHVTQWTSDSHLHRPIALACCDLWNSGLPHLAREVLSVYLDTHGNGVECSHKHELVGLLPLELRAVQLLLDTQVCCARNVKENIVEIKKIERLCRETNHLGEAAEMHQRWVYATCALALAHGYQRSESAYFALEHIRQSLAICQDAILDLHHKRDIILPLGDLDGNSTLVSTLEQQFIARRIDCLRRKSLIYAAAGKHRNAEAHAVSMLRESGGNTSTKRLGSRWTFGKTSFGLDLLNPKQVAPFRLIMLLQAKASSAEKVDGLFTRDQVVSSFLADANPENSLHSLAVRLQSLWNLMAVGDSVYQPFHQKSGTSEEIYRRLARGSASLLSSRVANDYLASLSSGLQKEVGKDALNDIQSRVTLGDVRLLLDRFSVDHTQAVSAFCSALAESHRAPIECRAWALFYLALIEISSARRTGALHRLWTRNVDMVEQLGLDQSDASTSPTSHGRTDPLGAARFYLREALDVAGPASHLLARDVMRCLALVTGPIHECQPVGYSTVALMHTSIGSTARQSVAMTVDRQHSNDIKWAFEALDTTFDTKKKRNNAIDELLDHTGRLLPGSARVVSASLCPTGDILLSSIVPNETDPESSIHTSSMCILAPESLSEKLFQSGLYDEILNPLDKLIQRNEDHLSGLDMETIAGQYNDSSSKRSWWDERRQIDEALQQHIRRVEKDFFHETAIQQLFAGDISEIYGEHAWMEVSCGNLASKFEEACGVDDQGGDATVSDSVIFHHKDAQALTVVELRNELVSLGIDRKRISKTRKKDLIELLLQESSGRRLKSYSAGLPKEAPPSSNQGSSQTIFLVLDEHLHRFPWEGMQMLKGKAVCRVPSLPFALAPFLGKESESSPSIDPQGARYVVDPEGNLGNTKDRLVPVVESISSRNHWGWEGVIGTVPSSDFIEDALTKENGLLVYCGHGGGQSCFSRSKVEKLMQGERKCRASLILMGCSSGKLESVNRKESRYIGRTSIHYEPEGIALSYLCAGAPCVVGNLWDVTDHDIDRYCVALLESFLNDEGTKSLAQCVADARSSCKMRHIVGLAPVCYGVPLQLRKPTIP